MGCTFNAKTLLKRIMTEFNEADEVDDDKEDPADEDH